MVNTHAKETTTDEYTSALSRRLRWALPTDKADIIVAETKAHLADRVENLMEQGEERPAAERIAISGFGKVSAYSRAVIRSAFEDRASVRARQWAGVAGALLLVYALSLCERWIDLPNWLRTPHMKRIFLDPSPYLSLFDIFNLSLVGAFGMLAFLSKRPQTRLFLALALAGTLASFLNGGLNFVQFCPYPKILRQEYQEYNVSRQEIAEHRTDIADENEMDGDVRLLRLGCEVYSKKNPVVPRDLIQNGYYIIPNTNSEAYVDP